MQGDEKVYSSIHVLRLFGDGIRGDGIRGGGGGDLNDFLIFFYQLPYSFYSISLDCACTYQQ